MILKAKKDDYLNKIEVGYEKMKNYKVAICSIVRDCEKPLKSNIPVVEKLRNCFKDSHVIVVENDSKDGTKDVLKRWSEKDANVHVISEDIGVQTIPEKNGDVRPRFSCHRIKLMASYRNKYMEFLENSDWDPDYVIIVDLDLEKINLDGIANSFGQDTEWDVVTAYGIMHYEDGEKYYDFYAYQGLGHEGVHTENYMQSARKELSLLKDDNKMIRVASAFGGMAIYKGEAIKGLRYRSEKNNDPNVESLCEHVVFQGDMDKNGSGKVFINPCMAVYYNSKQSEMKLFVKGILGEKTIGFIDFFRCPNKRKAWGGPFNNQSRREEIFKELIKICNFENILETGTFRGTTAEYMQKTSGLNVYTVEAVKNNYGFCLARFLFNKNISLYFGDSRSFLKQYFLKNQSKVKQVFFYLDAHWEKDLPLYEECKIILNNTCNAVIMIDDFKVEGDEGYLFDDYGENKILCLDYIRSLKSHIDDVFFPIAKSENETGSKRGCVVLTRSAEMTELLNKAKTLREYKW